MLLILDMNLSPDWVDVLAREGFEAGIGQTWGR